MADIREAIQLNPNDVGKDYEPTSNRALSSEDLRHGDEQVRQMLADRPAMAEHVTPHDPLWTWAVRKFAGEDLGTPIDWDSSDPSPFGSDCVRGTEGGHARIRVGTTSADSPVERPQPLRPFEVLWSRAVFELHNVASARDFAAADERAANGQISREEYILSMLEMEERASQRTRAFYIKFFLPWAESLHLQHTPWVWDCLTFYPNIEVRNAEWRHSPHWSYYSTWFDLLRIPEEYRQERYEEVTRRLERLEVQKDVLSPRQLVTIHYWRGHLLWVAGDISKAVKSFTAALAIDPSSQETAFVRANALMADGALDEAVREFTKLIEDHDKWEEPYYGRALARAELGEGERALADLNAALRLNENYVAAYVARGAYFAAQGNLEAALADFDAAIVLDPDNAEICEHRGWLWLNQAEYDKALNEYSKIVRIAPKDPRGYHARAQVFAAQGDCEKALADLDAAIRLDPKLIGAYFDRGKVHLRSKRYQLAWEDFSRVVEAEPNRPEGYAARAEVAIAWDESHRSNAIQDAHCACELSDWKSPEFIQILSRVYAATGYDSRPRELEKRAIGVEGDVSDPSSKVGSSRER